MLQQAHDGGEICAKAVFQRGGKPIRAIQRHKLCKGCMVLLLRVRQRRRRVPLTGEQRGRVQPRRPQTAQHQTPPGFTAPQSGEGPPAAQCGEHRIAHRGPVARPGKAAGPAPVGQRLLGGSTRQNTVQHCTCCRQARRRRHVLRSTLRASLQGIENPSALDFLKRISAVHHQHRPRDIAGPGRRQKPDAGRHFIRRAWAPHRCIAPGPQFALA